MFGIDAVDEKDTLVIVLPASSILLLTKLEWSPLD